MSIIPKVLQWPMIEVKGGAVVVPQVCPNCMGDGTWRWRHGHKYFLSNTTYYQTFYYCDACSDILSNERRIGRLQWLIGIPLFLCLVGLEILVAWTWPQAGSDGIWLAAGTLPLLVPIIVGYLIGYRMRAAKPLPAHALGRTPAAYYTGKTFAGLGGRDVYRARRQEWLDLLVRANPDQVRGEEYAQRTGEAKPAKEKPF
jgi:hypothetical protein